MAFLSDACCTADYLGKQTPSDKRTILFHTYPNGHNALHETCAIGAMDTLHVLLMHAGAVGAKNDYLSVQSRGGLNALGISIRHGRLNAVKVLLAVSTKHYITEQDRKCRTPLYFAVELGHLGIVQTLLEQSGHLLEECLVRGCGPSNQPPLHRAIIYGRTRIALAIVNSSTPTHFRWSIWNARDSFGNTPVHLLAQYGCMPVLEVLVYSFRAERSCLVQRCLLTCKNKAGQTPPDLAHQYGRRHVLIYLFRLVKVMQERRKCLLHPNDVPGAGLQT